MPCPDLGALRASIDDGGAPAPVLEHARGCAACSDTLAELQRNAELAAPAIALTAPDDPPAAAEVEPWPGSSSAGRGWPPARTVPARRPRPRPPPPPAGACPPTPAPVPLAGAAGWPGWGPGPVGWRRPWSRPWC